jgi:putative ABC transport system permease protein
MNAFRIALRYIARQRARALFTLLGVTLSCGACFAVVGLMQGFERTFLAGVQETGSDLIVGTANSLTGGSIPQDIAGKLGAVPGVKAADGILVTMLTIDSKRNYSVLGRPFDSFSALQVKSIAGRMPQRGETGVVVIGDRLASMIGKKVGDSVTIDYSTFLVVGVAEFASYMNRAMILMPLNELQTLTMRPQSVSFIEVRLDRSATVETQAKAQQSLSTISAPFEVLNVQDFVNDLRIVEVVKSVAKTVAAIMLLVTIMIVANTMLMSVSERAFDFGVLTAIGWSRGSIVRLILVEAALLTLVGTILGLGFGTAAMFSAKQVPQQSIYGLPIDPLTVLEISCATIIAGLAGALYPALKALRMNAVEALRKA